METPRGSGVSVADSAGEWGLSSDTFYLLVVEDSCIVYLNLRFWCLPTSRKGKGREGGQEKKQAGRKGHPTTSPHTTGTTMLCHPHHPHLLGPMALNEEVRLVPARHVR